MIDEDALLFYPAKWKEGEEIEVTLSLTEKEKKLLPLLVSSSNLSFVVRVIALSSIIELNLSVEGDCILEDAHTHEEITYPLSDSVDVVLGVDEDADILPEEDGGYNLRGAFLALLFNAIPMNYSEVELEKIQTDDYVLMSEEEYEKERGKNNPFADLED